MAHHPTTGRVALFDGPDLPLRLESRPLPEVGLTEALVRVTACTLCGSDLHTFQGRRAVATPICLGHEIAGRIQAFGSAHPAEDLRGKALKSGDRVTWTIWAACGSCFYCERGLPQKCQRVFKYGHESSGAAERFSGGLAEYCLLRKGTGIVKLPDNLPDTLAATVNCATATVAGSLRVAEVEPQMTALVLGAGTLGLNACAMLSTLGAGTIICSDPVLERRAMADRFGANVTVGSDPSELEVAVKRQTLGYGVDLLCDYTGSTSAVAAALPLLRNGGRAVLIGSVFPDEPLPLNLEQVVRNCWQICGLHNSTGGDLLNAVDFLATNQTKFPFGEIISAAFELEQIDAAFAHAGSQTGLRVAVIP